MVDLRKNDVKNMLWYYLRYDTKGQKFIYNHIFEKWTNVYMKECHKYYMYAYVYIYTYTFRWVDLPFVNGTTSIVN